MKKIIIMKIKNNFLFFIFYIIKKLNDKILNIKIKKLILLYIKLFQSKIIKY